MLDLHYAAPSSTKIVACSFPFADTPQPFLCAAYGRHGSSRVLFLAPRSRVLSLLTIGTGSSLFGLHYPTTRNLAILELRALGHLGHFNDSMGCRRTGNRKFCRSNPTSFFLSLKMVCIGGLQCILWSRDHTRQQAATRTRKPPPLVFGREGLCFRHRFRSPAYLLNRLRFGGMNTETTDRPAWNPALIATRCGEEIAAGVLPVVFCA